MVAKRPDRNRDSLDEYQRKRDLTRSPEPGGSEHVQRQRNRGKFSRQPMFCVQKHLASHLHYDFRLEHRGVLLSWAVPKGPSLNPRDKRLAMQTEDHPLDYGEFEGVIPEGYGAGIVLLWDLGRWEPEPGYEDVDAALKQGELKLRLDGYKLKGSWVLVRTKGGYGRGRPSGKDEAGPGASRSWLLMKHRDEWAGAVDVTELTPQSVKSGGDFADVLAEGDPEMWESDRPAKGGATGKLFDRIIRQAAEMKVQRRRAGKSAKTPDEASGRGGRRGGQKS